MVNNGIYHKAERDIKTSTAFRQFFDGGFWIPELIRPNIPLNIYHNIPSFIALGLGLISSTFIFSLEFFLPQKKSDNMTVGIQPRSVPKSDVSDPKRKDGIHRQGTLCVACQLLASQDLPNGRYKIFNSSSLCFKDKIVNSFQEKLHLLLGNRGA